MGVLCIKYNKLFIGFMVLDRKFFAKPRLIQCANFFGGIIYSRFPVLASYIQLIQLHLDRL